MQSSDTTGELANEWQGGDNQWVSEEELQNLTPRFKDIDELLAGLNTSPPYSERTVTYQQGEH